MSDVERRRCDNCRRPYYIIIGSPKPCPYCTPGEDMDENQTPLEEAKDNLKASVEEIKNQSQSFYQKHQNGIDALLVVGGILLINRHLTKRVVKKIVSQQLASFQYVVDYLPVEDMAKLGPGGTLTVVGKPV